MKHVLSLFIFAFAFINVKAEDMQDTIPNWKKGGNISLTFSQVSFGNWAAGGQNSQAGNFLFDAFVNYKKEKHAWDNSFVLGYGLTRQGSEKLIKSDDRILLTSKYGYHSGGNWFYSGLLDFKTQMTTGYQDPPTNSIIISELFAPGYLTASLGMDYKKNDEFSLYLSPLTAKMTFVMDDDLSNAGAFGVDPGENFRGEFGALVKSVYQKKDLIKNVDFITRIDLFSNLADNPQHIDVDWEARLNMKINKYLTALFSVNLLYDDDIKYVDSGGNIRGARIQSKQILGFGLTYGF